MMTTEIQPNITTLMPTQVTPDAENDTLFLVSTVGGVSLGLLFLMVVVVIIINIVMAVRKRKKNTVTRRVLHPGISAVNLVSRDYEREGMPWFFI